MTHRSLSQWDALAGSSAADQLDDGSVGITTKEQTFLIHDNTVYHHGNCTNKNIKQHKHKNKKSVYETMETFKICFMYKYQE